MCAERISVGRLALSAPSRRAMSGVVPELEDALRTTSWPTNAGAVLMIRRLDLGVIRRGATRHQMGRVIARNLAQMPLYWSQPGRVDDHAPALGWPSRPHVLASCAVVLLGRVGRPAPWWLRSALTVLKGRAPNLSDLLRALREEFETRGTPALAAVFTVLIQEGYPDIAVQLLAHSAEVVASAVAPLDAQVKAQVWSDMPDQQTVVTDPDTPNLALLATRLDRLITQPEISQLWHAICSHPGFSTQAPALRVQMAFLLLLGARAPISLPSLTRRIAQWVEEVRAAVRDPATQALPLLETQIMPKPALAESFEKNPSNVVPDSTDQTTHPASERSDPSATVIGPGLPTGAAGIPVLLNLLARCGLPEWDAAHQTDLSLRLLHGFGVRVAEQDHMQEAWPPMDADLIWPEGSFCLPDHLLAPFANRLTLGPAREGLRPVALRGAECLFGWVDPQDHGALIDAGVGPMPVAQTRSWTPNALLNGAALVLQRAYFETTGTGWRAGAQRPGFVAATATHIDVTLDLNDVHLPERLVALDASPGWVPWLGRVVSLHFERLVMPEGRV